MGEENPFYILRKQLVPLLSKSKNHAVRRCFSRAVMLEVGALPISAHLHKF